MAAVDLAIPESVAEDKVPVAGLVPLRLDSKRTTGSVDVRP